MSYINVRPNADSFMHRTELKQQKNAEKN